MNTILTEEEHNGVLDVIGTIGLIGDLIGQQPGASLQISSDNLSALVTTLRTPLQSALDAATQRNKLFQQQPVLIGFTARDLACLMQACEEGIASIGQGWVDRLTQQFGAAVSADPDVGIAAQHWESLLAAETAACAQQGEHAAGNRSASTNFGNLKPLTIKELDERLKVFGARMNNAWAQGATPRAAVKHTKARVAR